MFNSFKTAILLTALTALILLIGGSFGGQQGLIIAFIFAVVMNGSSYWFSDKIVLSLYRDERSNTGKKSRPRRGSCH